MVTLLGWIDDYENMLERAGLDSTNLLHLKTKVKILMPFFINHNQKILHEFIQNSIADDEKNYNRKFYDELIREGSDLVSLFPSNVFRFIKNEAEFIRDKLRGEIFIEFVRVNTNVCSASLKL